MRRAAKCALAMSFRGFSFANEQLGDCRVIQDQFAAAHCERRSSRYRLLAAFAPFALAAFRALAAFSSAFVCFVEVFSVGVFVAFIASAVARLLPDLRRPPACDLLLALFVGRDFASIAAFAFAGRPVFAVERGFGAAFAPRP